MKLRRCSNGHFYRDDGTGRCQLCQHLADPPTEALWTKGDWTKGDGSYVSDPPFVGGGVLDAPLPSAAASPQSAAAPPPTATPPQPAATPPSTTPAAPTPAAPAQQPQASPLDDVHTVAVFETPVSINPVVGWLVSRRGSYFGQGFELHSGQNSVGRSLDMDVPLPQDAAVERIRHCMVIFEPQRQDFFLHVDGRSGPVYLNDERITQNRLLQKRDVIRLGGSELVFFPLCGEAFSWQEVLTA